LGFLPTRLLLSESGLQVLVNSGADSVSHSARPNQNVGRNWKLQVVPPLPVAFGCTSGSLGSVMVLPEPGIFDLNNTDGSSWPT
jgi:hypothetical protein